MKRPVNDRCEGDKQAVKTQSQKMAPNENEVRIMKEQIIAKVKEAIEAPSCCAGLKAAGEKYLQAVEANAGSAEAKEAAKELVAELEADVNPIEDSIAFFESDMGKQVFGDQLEGMLASFKEAQAAGEDTCLCPACQAGKALLGMKEEILG